MNDAHYELIVFGATSFVGKILCEYLASECSEADLSWAMAGRSEEKLVALKNQLGLQAIPHFLADSSDEQALTSLCNQSSVIISTVGPYALYGETLVRVCAESGTDYCDLTGEAQWIRRMVDRYEATARASGARIVHSCGFDSIPSDLGVFFLQQAAMKQHGQYCSTIKMRVKSMKGGASGGTIASGINLYKEAAKDLALRAEMADPYSLCGKNHGFKVQQQDVGVEQDMEFNSWVGPFVMAAINSRIVLRSNALAKPSYGAEFCYNEGMLTGPGVKGEKAAKRLALAIKLGGTAMAIPPLRWLAQTFILPKPGEGPSPEQQRNGYFDLRFLGTLSSGERIRAQVTGDRDPGYGSTAKMLAQSGISLARDFNAGEADSIGGGFWTPATLFGDLLLSRLTLHAGLEFTLLDQFED